MFTYPYATLKPGSDRRCNRSSMLSCTRSWDLPPKFFKIECKMVQDDVTCYLSLKNLGNFGELWEKLRHRGEATGSLPTAAENIASNPVTSKCCILVSSQLQPYTSPLTNNRIPCNQWQNSQSFWPQHNHLFFKCWMLPMHLKPPFTMIAMRLQSASHSSMLHCRITS